jgi:hypothetical protein
MTKLIINSFLIFDKRYGKMPIKLFAQFVFIALTGYSNILGISFLYGL